MKKLNLIIALTVIIFSISSCSKEGTQGPAGKDGTNGTNGANGNANVHSRNFIVTSWNGVNTSGVYIILADMDITQSIIDSGAVLVYQEVSGTWYALPRSNFGDQWAFNFYLNNIVIQLSHSNGTQVPNPGTNTFKVVVIAGSNRLSNPNLNWSNYNEVKVAYGLKD